MTKPQYVCIGGPMHSGKSEAAKALTGYTVVKFADALKDMMCELYRLTRVELEAAKDEPRPLTIGGRELAIIAHHFGKRIPNGANEHLFGRKLPTIRASMQIIGTDVIRAIDPDWHVRKLLATLKPGVAYVADDCRYPNELAAFADPVTIYITRPGLEPAEHESENSLSAADFQFVVVNDGTIEELREKIRAIVNQL